MALKAEKCALSEWPDNTFNLLRLAFWGLLLFALAVRVTAALCYYNEYDTFWYRAWAFDMSNGFFNIYSRAEAISLDYPPLYLFLLYITNLLYRLFGFNCGNIMQMFLMKMWPVLTDMACGCLFYIAFKKRQNAPLGLLAAALWWFNPSAIFNCAFWGQTDSLMCLLLLGSFILLENRQFLLSSVLFAVAGLTKFQCLFLLPVFLFLLFYFAKPKKFFAGISAAAATVFAVFLPFMIGSKNPLLFFKVYFGGQATYQKNTLNACNIYTFLFKNWQEESAVFFGGISYRTFSAIMLIIIAAVTLFLLFCAKQKNIYVLSFWLINSLFMFTVRMHERYQFVVMVLLLAAGLFYRQKRFIVLYFWATAITLYNQLVPMLSWNSGSVFINENYNILLGLGAYVNVLFYIVSTVICFAYLFCKDSKERTVQE